MEEVHLEGMLFGEGYTYLQSYNNGVVNTDGFLLRKSGTLYENHLESAHLDRKKLPPFFGERYFLPTARISALHNGFVRDRRIRSATLVETLVATVLLLLLIAFDITLMIALQSLQHSISFKRFQSEIFIQQMVLDAKLAKIF